MSRTERTDKMTGLQVGRNPDLFLGPLRPSLRSASFNCDSQSKASLRSD